MKWLLILALLVPWSSARAGEQAELSEEAKAALASYSKLNFQIGEIDLQNGLAKLKLTDDFRFLPARDAKTVLVDFWGNSPNQDPLGMIVPAGVHLLSTNAWAVIVNYEESGYIKDTDADGIDYSELLKNMRRNIRDSNAERKKQGYPTLELVGWAKPPRYEKQAHKLHWAKELRFDDNEENTVNYDIRVLGRRGVLSMNTVASMSRFQEIADRAPEIVQMADFTPGNRYSDFDASSDKVATYGLAALVAGGIAAKTGLLKGLLLGLLAAKKFVILGFVAIAAAARKLFSRNQG